MPATTQPISDPYAWEVQPAAAVWVAREVDALIQRSGTVARLARLLHDETGTRLVDWIDHLAYADDDHRNGNGRLDSQLVEVGFVAESAEVYGQTAWRHPLGMFPPVVVGAERTALAFRVDSIQDALASLPSAIGLPAVAREKVVGQAGGRFRHVLLCQENGVNLLLTERHGYAGFAAITDDSQKIAAGNRLLNEFLKRQRAFADSDDAFQYTSQLFEKAAGELGVAWACDLFFIAERDYWQGRNRAGQIQYERQNRLGLGWANHDHHTYRSSRRAFHSLIAVLEQMGFECRERFYAGREAGWGAQVLEQPECRVVIFADVDLSPDEVLCDFAHEPLAERDALGTVGLWCELHGEAFLQAGMHHLECQFEFEAAREQLKAAGIETLAPFTDFTFLRQAFTRGETWPVDPARIDRLASAGRITAEQADRFRREGVIGSHLEILERNDGYKGFNQTGISDIITRTDPRRVVGA